MFFFFFLLSVCLLWGNVYPSSKYLQAMHAREGMKKKEPSYPVGGDVSWCNLYGEQCGSSLKQLKLQLPSVLCCSLTSDSLQTCGLSPTRLLCPWGLLPVIFSTQGSKPGLLGNFTSSVTGEAHLDINLKKTIISKNTCTPMSTAAHFAKAWTWKQLKCPSTEQGIKKMWYICTVEYYSAIKKNETMLLTGTRMDLETVKVSEVSQKEKDKYIISLMWNLQK